MPAPPAGAAVQRCMRPASQRLARRALARCLRAQALPADNNFTAAIGSDAAPAVCGADGGLLDGDECQANLSDNCPAGRRPVALPDGGKACPRCRAGG